MRVAGICGSDLHVYRREPRKNPEHTHVPGHEPCGVVESVGEGVTNVRPGDRVTVYHYQSCGLCGRCREGNWMWCSQIRAYGWHVQGSCADKIVADARNCLPLPKELSYADGAFIACGAGTTWSALRKVRPTAEDVAVVFGLGPIGLVGVAMLEAFGTPVIAVGRRAGRLAVAEQLGADLIIDIDQDEDPVATVQRHFPQGVPLAYETSGSPVAQQQMIRCLSRGGRAACVGIGNREPAINLGGITGKQLTLHGSFVMNAGEYDALSTFMVRKNLNMDRLVTHRFGIEQAQEAFEMADTGDCAKVVLEWPDE